MPLFGPPKIKVHLLIRGRVGDGWLDVDQAIKVPEGTTLAGLIEIAERRGVPLREALENSPHLADTIMLNGERCPVADNADRTLADGDELFLLAPIAGG